VTANAPRCAWRTAADHRERRGGRAALAVARPPIPALEQRRGLRMRSHGSCLAPDRGTLTDNRMSRPGSHAMERQLMSARQVPRASVEVVPPREFPCSTSSRHRHQPGGVETVVVACDWRGAARTRRAPPLTIVSGAVIARHVDRWVHRSRSGKAW
jgi:hypothetical protein